MTDLWTQKPACCMYSSETGMQVAGLMKLVEDKGKLFVIVRWKGLSEADDIFEPVEQFYKDVPGMRKKLLRRKNAPPDLARKARSTLVF